VVSQLIISRIVVCRWFNTEPHWTPSWSIVDRGTLSERGFKDSRHSQLKEVKMATNTTTASAAPRAPEANNRKRLKKFTVGAGVLIVAFLLGYVPSSISSRNTQQQYGELEHKLRFARVSSVSTQATAMINWFIKTLSVYVRSCRQIRTSTLITVRAMFQVTAGATLTITPCR
jgi:hypothetical protein